MITAKLSRICYKRCCSGNGTLLSFETKEKMECYLRLFMGKSLPNIATCVSRPVGFCSQKDCFEQILGVSSVNELSVGHQTVQSKIQPFGRPPSAMGFRRARQGFEKSLRFDQLHRKKRHDEFSERILQKYERICV
jgi:hypothetical protein